MLAAAGLHLGCHWYIFQTLQDGQINKASLATLFSTVLLPSVLFLLCGMYKWRDDKWRITKFVVICQILSQAFILAFEGIVAYVYSTVIGGALIFTHILSIIALIGAAEWITNGFYLSRRSKVMLGCIFIIFIGASIAGAIMMSGKYAYTSFTASWFCLTSLFMTYAMSSTLPKVKGGNLFPSDDVFPVYEWDPARNN